MAVTFPTSNPDGQARAHVEAGASLDDVPTWSLQTLNAGPARSSPAYDRHLEATIGSSYDWSDELRFDKRTGRLKSFVLGTPEAGEYLALVVAPNIERMGDEDPALGAALRALRARVRTVDGRQARTLEGGIERVLETFYPG